MSNKSVLKVSALAVAIAASAAPLAAVAEVSGSLAITSQYLWRGQQLSFGPTVNGSLDYGHESGAYAGIWTSSEVGDTEYDLYAGFAGEAGGLSYDIAYVDYNYTAGGTPQIVRPADKAADGDFEEVYLGLGMGDFGLDVYLGVGDYGHPSSGAGTDNEDNYYAASYGYDKYGVVVGYFDFAGDPDTPEANVSNNPDYIHLDLSYALTDQFTFTASKIVDQEQVAKADTIDDDLLFSVAYSFAL